MSRYKMDVVGIKKDTKHEVGNDAKDEEKHPARHEEELLDAGVCEVDAKDEVDPARHEEEVPDDIGEVQSCDVASSGQGGGHGVQD